jgi:hypothetical protein
VRHRRGSGERLLVHAVEQERALLDVRHRPGDQQPDGCEHEQAGDQPGPQ